jgi:hypothetical protein
MLVIKPFKFKRCISSTLCAPMFACVLAFTSTTALCKGVDLHFQMQPIRGVQTSFAVPDINLRVLSSTVRQIAITSELSQGETVLETNALADAYKLDAEALRKTGGAVDFRSPHQQYLKPGVYAQQVDITIWDSELDIPVVQRLVRYFRAGTDGVAPISAEEYSRVVEPALTFIDQSGRKTLEYRGSRLGRKLTLDGKLGFDRQDVAESAAANGDLSERNEP